MPQPATGFRRAVPPAVRSRSIGDGRTCTRSGRTSRRIARCSIPDTFRPRTTWTSRRSWAWSSCSRTRCSRPLRANVTVGPWADSTASSRIGCWSRTRSSRLSLALLAAVGLARGVARGRARPARPLPRGDRAVRVTRRVLAFYLAAVRARLHVVRAHPLVLQPLSGGADPADDRGPAGRGRARRSPAAAAAPRGDASGDRGRDRRLPAGPVSVLRAAALVGHAAERLPRHAGTRWAPHIGPISASARSRPASTATSAAATSSTSTAR